MSIKRLNEFPEGSGLLSNDDVFIFMDDPNGSGITNKVSLKYLKKPITLFYMSGIFPSTMHDLDHQDAENIIFDLRNNSNVTSYLSLTGMKKGYNGQRITLINATTHSGINNPGISGKNINIYSQLFGSGSLPDNRFFFHGGTSFNPIGLQLFPNQKVNCYYNTNINKWIPTYILGVSSQELNNTTGSVGQGGV